MELSDRTPVKEGQGGAARLFQLSTAGHESDRKYKSPFSQAKNLRPPSKGCR